MEVNKNQKDIDFKFISTTVLNSVNRPKDFAMINPVKIKSRHKIYKLQKSGSLTNKSVVDSVVMACEESDKNGSLLFTNDSQQNNSSHPVNDGLQQYLISDDINGSSSESVPLNNEVMIKPCSSSENTFHFKDLDPGNGKSTLEHISHKVTKNEHVSSEAFDNCTKELTKKHSSPLDSAEPYQNQKENTISKINKLCKKGKSLKISPVKKMGLQKKKYSRHARKGQAIKQFESCDETGIATIPMEIIKEKVPEMVAQEILFGKTEKFKPVKLSSIPSDTQQLTDLESFGPAAFPSTSTDSLFLDGSEAFRPAVPSSTAHDIPTVKGPEMTMYDGNHGKPPKTRSPSVKPSSTLKKRKRTNNHLKIDVPRMSRRQRWDQLVESECKITVDLSFKMPNPDISLSTTGLSNDDKVNLVPTNISGDSKKTDNKSKFISHKKDFAISLLGCETSFDNIVKTDQSTADSNFSRELIQHQICTKLRTPSKCVVVLPEELRKSTDKSAALLSTNSPTMYKSEAIQNLDVVLSQKRCRDLSPANMSPVRLSKDVISAPVHKTLLLPDVRHVKSNEKTSVLAEWKQTGDFLLETLYSACSETVLEDQTSEANSDLNVSVLPLSVLFPNTTFSKSSEERSLSSIFEFVKAYETPTPNNKKFKPCQGVSISGECDSSIVSAQGSDSNCLINSLNIVGSHTQAEDDFGDSITSQTTTDHGTKTSTAPAFNVELPVKSYTQTPTRAELGTPSLISPNHEAPLSLYLSSSEQSGNGDDYSLDKSCASVGADPVNADDENPSTCANTDAMDTICLAGYKATNDFSQPETAQHYDAWSSSVGPRYSCCSTPCKGNKAAENDPCVSKDTIYPSCSTILRVTSIQKPSVKTKAIKKVRHPKSRTASLANVKNLDKITPSEYVKPKSLLKPRNNLKNKKSFCPVSQQKSVENWENSTTFVTNALVHAHVNQYCTPEKLHKPSHDKPVHAHSNQPCMPEMHQTPQNMIEHAHSDQHHTPENLCKTPRSPLSSDTRSGIVLRSASKSTPDDLPAALNKHNPMLQTSLYPFRSCNEQESSSLYWFSEVATTYAYEIASSADSQKLNVSENKLLTNLSKEIQESAQLASSSSIATKARNTESMNSCDIATTNSPNSQVTRCYKTSPCNNLLIKNSNKSYVKNILEAEDSTCEREQMDETGNSQEKIIILSDSLQDNATEYQDALHDSSSIGRNLSTTALLMSDNEYCNFEGFQPSDIVKNAQSVANSFDRPQTSGNQHPLPTSVASDEHCSDAGSTDLTFMKHSSCRRTRISKRKRSLRGSSLADLVVRKYNFKSIHKFSPSKVTSRLNYDHTSSDMDNVNKGKVSSHKHGKKSTFEKRSKTMSTKAINPVRQIDETSKPQFRKRSILPPFAMNIVNANVSRISIPNSTTTTTTITGSSEIETSRIQSSQTFIEHNEGTIADNQASISNIKNVAIENSLHKSTNTSFDIQDHCDNHLDTLPDEFLSDITCTKAAKGCTVRCRDPRSDPPGLPYECLTCSINGSFQSLVSLLQHIMIVHANAPPASVGGSDHHSLQSSDSVDTIASNPLGKETGARVENEQTSLAEISCDKEYQIYGASNDQCDDVDECSAAVDCGSDHSRGIAEVWSNLPGASDCSARNEDNDKVPSKKSDNEIVKRKERDNTDSLVNRSEAVIANDQKNGMHSVERKRKKAGDVNTRISDTSHIKRKKNKTTDRNQRGSERDDANKHINESDDAEILRNDVMNGKKTISSGINVNNEVPTSFAVNNLRSVSSEVNSKKTSFTLNCTKIEPNNSTPNKTVSDNADRKKSIVLNSPEVHQKCGKKQRSTKRKRGAGRVSKKVPCLRVKEEYKPPPIVMNPCRPRRGFVLIPSMTPDDVERLLSVQRKAFNDTFKMKRREIIAKNKEAGIDVSKQLVMVNGTKRYQCEKCPTSVSTVALLLNHMVTHQSSELAIFSCAFCPKTFRYGTALKLHLEKHGNIMRYFCPICNLGLQQEAKLRYHIMLHAQKKRTVFACKKCDKKFNSTALLAGHSKVHYPDLKYRCRESECNFVCIGRGELSKHFKAEHKKERAKKD